MVAIPLVARGRGVAVMYADHGTAGGSVNLEALETIVRVAALTVELLASSHAAKIEDRQASAADFEHTQFDAEPAAAESPFASSFAEPAEEYPVQEPVAEESVPDFSFSESVSYQSGFGGTCVY